MEPDRRIRRPRGAALGALLVLVALGAATRARADTSVVGPALGGYCAELQLTPECRLGAFDEVGSLCLVDGASAGVALLSPSMLLGSGEAPAVLGLRGGAGFHVPRGGNEEHRDPLEVFAAVKLSSVELGVSIAGGPDAAFELRGRLGLMLEGAFLGELSLGGAF
jgi:hypothetical protein